MPFFKSILLIGNFLSNTVGTQGISEELSVLLKNLGWEVICASNQINKIYRLLDMLTTAYNTRSEYQIANVDVFSGTAFIWAETVSYLLVVLKKPFNLTLRGGALPDFALRYPHRMQRLLASADSVITPSKYLQKYFSEIYPEIQWLPNGLDLAHYRVGERSNQPRLVWLRAFHEIYHPQLAVEVLAILRAAGIDCTLTMIGPDKDDGTYQACVEFAKQNGILDKIQFTGPVEKKTVPSWLNKGEIFLNTTCYESFGVSVLEAAACGLPIVTTNVGELPYLWEDEVDALLVPPDDPQAMAAAVQRILTEPGLAEKLSRNARKKAEGFDWSIILPQWEALFQTLINNA